MLTKTNIEASDYLSVNPTNKWATGKNYGASFGVASGDYFNMSSGRTLTATISGVESFSVFVYNKTKGRQYSVQIGTDEAKTITHGGNALESSGVIATNNSGEITVKITGLDDSVYPVAIVVNKAPEVNDATLRSITVNEEEIEGFAPETTTYNVELPFGTTVVPVVAATPTSSKATVSVTQAAAVNGKATIHVVAEDGKTTKDYTVQFSVAAAASEDATLASLSIDGKAIADFKADSLDYTYSVAYLSESIPVISAEANDESANVAITQATAIPGTATIVVTAQAGNKTTYTMKISRADAIKHLTVVPFSNGAKGAINESDLTVTVPYLNGTAVPTLVAESIQVSGDTTNTTKPTATCNADGTITLKGIDNKEAIYSVVTHPLSAIAMTENVVTFDSTELYIFAPYGWASDKGWKFAKKVNDETNMRDASGNTRIYMALPPADSVQLTSGSGAKRDVIIYVNGAKSSVTKTAETGKTITLTLSQDENNFVAIESNQTNGDGGFTKIQLFNPSEPIGSALDQTQVEAKATKVIRNGQLLIIREGKTYTVQGVEVE